MKCRFKDLCRKRFHYEKADECSHEESWECPIAAKIEDLLMDGADADQDREFDDEDEVPFCEPYDGPEEEDDL